MSLLGFYDLNIKNRPSRTDWADAIAAALPALRPTTADLDMFRGLLAGRQTADLARALDLLRPCRRDDGRVSIEGQQAMLAALEGMDLPEPYVTPPAPRKNDLEGRLRACAAEGLSQAETARKLGLNAATVSEGARRHGIKFQPGKKGGNHTQKFAVGGPSSPDSPEPGRCDREDTPATTPTT